MNGFDKVFVGFAITFFAGIIFLNIFRNGDFLEYGIYAYGVIALISIIFIYSGIVSLKKSNGESATKIEDGRYIIISYPTVETLEAGSYISYFTDIRKYNIQDAKLDSEESVHMIVQEAYGPYRYIKILKENITVDFWPLLFPDHMINIRNEAIEHIYKPGEWE